MSIYSVLPHRGFAGSGLRNWFAEARIWLRHMKRAADPQHQDLNDLSDRELRDISARQTDIGRLLDREKNWILQASLTRARSRIID